MSSCSALKWVTIFILVFVFGSSTCTSIPYGQRTNLPFKTALASFKTLRSVQPTLQSLKAHQPTCFISYAWGIPEHEAFVLSLAQDLKEAGVNVLFDKWHNKGGTDTARFAQKLLDPTTDFVILVGSKKLMEKYNGSEPSVLRLELEMISQRATWSTHTKNILPILLEGTHQDVLPPFLWGTVSIGFQNPKNYSSNFLSLLERLYQLDENDLYLAEIKNSLRDGRSPDFENVTAKQENTSLLTSSFDPLSPTLPWTSKQKLKLRAIQKDPQAQYELGVVYWTGEDTLKQPLKAVQWFEQAALQGHPEAQIALARIYLGFDKSNIQQDEKKALKWVKKLISRRNAVGQNLVGVMYQEGRAVSLDEKEAVKWYRKSAEQGYGPAQFNLGVMYAEGRGVDQDQNVAIEWYQKAAEQGFTPAQFNLAAMNEDLLKIYMK